MKNGADYKRLGLEEHSATASITAIAQSPVSQAQVAKEAALREMLMESEWGEEDYDVALIEDVIASALESDTNMGQEEMFLESGEAPATGIIRQGSITEAKLHCGVKAEQIWKPH
jgi:hypothetical protein